MRSIVCTFSMLKCIVVCAGFSVTYSLYLLHVEVCCVCAGFSEIYSSYLLHVEVCCCVQVSVRSIVCTFSMLKCVVVCRFQ